jgi:hypothetical protein
MDTNTIRIGNTNSITNPQNLSPGHPGRKLFPEPPPAAPKGFPAIFAQGLPAAPDQNLSY